MAKLSAKEAQIAPIIRELLAENPHQINSVMAEEAQRRLGRPVKRDDISRTRQRINLGVFQQMDSELSERLEAVVSVYQSEATKREKAVHEELLRLQKENLNLREKLLGLQDASSR